MLLSGWEGHHYSARFAVVRFHADPHLLFKGTVFRFSNGSKHQGVHFATETLARYALLDSHFVEDYGRVSGRNGK